MRSIKLVPCSIKHTDNDRGSLALEQILFIGAIVALSAGLFAFYDNLSNYFRNIGFSTPPTNIGSTSGSQTQP